ncbi:Malonyl CoA-acyl carrier protein transacylase [Collimonas arenae]|uniref:[acyl-carrier-protein] S-malonyltransferase n=2 Tax=Collimonas arenae TaxID=279058 RepID=A0A0A1FDU4_9BURK|nr:Malonyl CoA-acyl carrier protein transacylase [Collimonas arenae]
MGAELFARFPQLVREADEVLGYSIRELCLDDPKNVLKQTEYTQPALFVTSALSFLARREQGGAPPDVYAGHSLGEFNAIFAAGGFDFKTGVALVAERGRLMSQATPGAMAAVIGLDQDNVLELLASSPFDKIDIANINSSEQIVISGEEEQIARCDALFVAAGGRYVRLNVSAAFHSRFMRDVEQQFAAYLARMPLHTLKAEVIANCTAHPYPMSGYQELLARQITHPVKWYESVSRLLSRGAVALEEVGPGDVLTKLFFKIKQKPMPMPLPSRLGDSADASAAVQARNSQAVTGRKSVDGPLQPSRRTVFMYSGQGSQYYLMGKELYQNSAPFREAMDACDALHRAHTGRSMLAELYNDTKRHEEMTDVLLAHPALFSLGYSLTQVLLHAGIEPDGVLGYSLGEYVAATVAGVVSLEDAMAMVICQARLLSEQASGGGMLSVLTPVEHFERHADVYRGGTLASVNFSGNFVVSGDQRTLLAIKERLDAQEIVSLLLSVDHGFHSAAVEPIEAEFRRFLQSLPRQTPRLPIYSAMHGRAIDAFDDQYFWDVLRQRVDFYKLMGSLSGQEGVRFVDLGPTGTLSSFIKYGFGNRVDHAVSINQFGKNIETVSKLLTRLSA